MSVQERLHIDYDKSDFIRGINKNNKYLKFDNQKDLFIYAMVIGADCPSKFKGKREAFFHDKDLNYEDKAIMYAVVAPELDTLEDIANTDLIYDIAERMANTGFSIIQQNIESISLENMSKKLLSQLDEKYEEIKGNMGL